MIPFSINKILFEFQSARNAKKTVISNGFLIGPSKPKLSSGMQHTIKIITLVGIFFNYFQLFAYDTFTTTFQRKLIINSLEIYI